MNHPQIVSRDEWLVARKELLAREKEATRARDALSAERRKLPMVRIDKQYTFAGPHGPVRLLDLFEGRPQLIIHHSCSTQTGTRAAQAVRYSKMTAATCHIYTLATRHMLWSPVRR
jgi:predicted dithiol-disulfide oxidoreductase (DUF899 family)